MNIGIIYPFDNLYSYAAGNSVYASELNNFLHKKGHQLFILTYESKDLIRNNLFKTLFYKNIFLEAKLHNLTKLLIKFFIGKKNCNKIFEDFLHIKRFLAHRFSCDFKKKILLLSKNNIDCLIVHYPFSLYCLHKCIKNIPIILITHDILSQQFYHFSWSAKIVKQLELEAAAKAKICISLSKKDASFFLKANSKSYAIIHELFMCVGGYAIPPLWFQGIKENVRSMSILCGFSFLQKIF